MCENPAVFFPLPGRFETQEMSNNAIDVDPWQLKDVPNHFKKQKMCDKAVKDYPSSLLFVPDWFVKNNK